MTLKVNEKVNEKVNAVAEMIEKYMNDKCMMLAVGSIYGNKIGFHYANDEELRNLTAAYVYTEYKMKKEETKLKMMIDTKNKVAWIEVVIPEDTEEQVDLDIILKRIRSAQGIKDAKLERVTKAVERVLEEYADEIIGIVENMNEKDFLRVLYACGNEITPDEKDVIVTEYTSRRKEKK